MAPVTTARKSGPSLLMLYSMMFAGPCPAGSAAAVTVAVAVVVLALVATGAQPATALPSTPAPINAATCPRFISRPPCSA
jgi:hypothetical protein